MGWALYVHKAYVPRASSSITSVFCLYMYVLFFFACAEKQSVFAPQRQRAAGAR